MKSIGSGKDYKRAQVRLAKRQELWDKMRPEDRKRLGFTKRPGSAKRS